MNNSKTSILNPVCKSLIGFLLILSISASAQSQVKPVTTELPELSWATPPTAKQLIVKMEQGYLGVLKKSGDWVGQNTYSLLKLDEEGKIVMEKTFNPVKGHHLLGLFRLSNQYILLIDEPSPFAQNRYLMLYEIDAAQTNLKEGRRLDSLSPGTIPVKGEVGMVKETFENEVAAYLSFGSVPNPEARFEVNKSDNEEFLAISYVQWGPGGAEYQIKVLDNSLKTISDKEASVVPGYLHFGFKLSNWGELYGVSGDDKGNLIVEKYEDETKTILLSAASSFRSDPLIGIKSKNRVVVGSVNLFKDQLFGLQLQELDFENEELLETSFYKLEPELEKQLRLKSEEKGLLHYRLTDLRVNEKGEVFTILSQHWLNIPNAIFDRYGARKKRAAEFKSADVYAGPMLLMSFAADLQPRWHYLIPRTYAGKAEEGLMFHSAQFRNLNQPEVDFTFSIPAGEAPLKGFLKNIRIDRYSGLKKKEETLYSFNEGGILNPFSVFDGKKAVFLQRNAKRSKSHKLVSLSLP